MRPPFGGAITCRTRQSSPLVLLLGDISIVTMLMSPRSGRERSVCCGLQEIRVAVRFHSRAGGRALASQADPPPEPEPEPPSTT